MSQEPGALPAAMPGRPLSWSEAWLSAVTRPSVATYEELARDPNATAGRAYLWIVVAAVIGAVVQSILFGALSPGSAAFQGVAFLSLACYSIVGTVVAFFINSVVTQGVARALDGTGTYSQLAFALAAYIAPVSIAGSVLAFIPVLNLLVLLLVPYAIVLNVIAVKAVHQFSWGRAIGSSFVLILLLFALACILLTVGLVLLGPAIVNEI